MTFTCTAQQGRRGRTCRTTTNANARSSAALGRLLFVAGGTFLSPTTVRQCRLTACVVPAIVPALLVVVPTHALVLLPPSHSYKPGRRPLCFGDALHALHVHAGASPCAGRAQSCSALTLGRAGSSDDPDDPDGQQEWSSSWQQQHKLVSPLKKQYQKAGGILYRQSVLSPEEFDICTRELMHLIGKGGSLRLADETTSSVASNRVGGRIPPDSAIVDVLRKGSIFRLINEVEADNGHWVLSDDVPVEVRIYERAGAGMEWHVDDVLFSPKQVEVVLTMENTSDCITIWEEEVNLSLRRVEVETAPNSAILIKAGGARHKVSALKNGRRVILKFVYAHEGATLVEGAEKHTKQFASSSSSSLRSKKTQTRRKGTKKKKR